MKIKIGDLTKRQISKICQQRECCTIAADGYVCPLYNVSEWRCMAEFPYSDDCNDIEVDISEDMLELDSAKAMFLYGGF